MKHPLLDRDTLTDAERERWLTAPCARRRSRPPCAFCGQPIMRDGWLHPKVGRLHAHYQCTPGLGWSKRPPT